MPMNKTIIFIHGAWVTPKCWEKYISFFESKGYNCLAPAWPGKEGSIAEQNTNPSKKLEGLGIAEIVAHYEKIIRALPHPPIIIGHSFGGLFTEILLDKGLGSCGIAIDPAPPKGVFAFYPSVIKALRLTLLTPRAWKKILRWPFTHFSYAFVHTLSPSQQLEAYHDYVVPETGRVFAQSALSMFSNVTKVNFQNSSRAPLLIIAGSEDRIVPAKVNQSNYKKYKTSKAKTDFKEFPGRTHWIIAQEGWEETAEYIENWIQKIT